MHIFLKHYIFTIKYKIFIVHYQVFITHCQGTGLRIKHYTTKCKICFSSSINLVYNIKKIQFFGVDMIYHTGTCWDSL